MEGKMRTLSVSLIISIVFIFNACKENKILESDNDLEPKVPPQINEVDLIGFYNQDIYMIEVNPREPKNIFVSASNGFNDKLYVTNDYGISWKISFDSIGTACFKWHPTLANIAFVAKTAPLSRRQRNNLDYINPLLFKTTNKGLSWFPSENGIGRLFDDNISSIKFDFYDPQKIFVNATHHGMGMPGDITGWGYCYISTDGGNSFSDTVYYNLKKSPSLGLTSYLTDIDVSNVIPNLILGTIYNLDGYDLAISSDFGFNWFGKNIEDGDTYFDKISTYNMLIVLRGGYFMNAQWLKPWALTTTENYLYISRDLGNTFFKVDRANLDYSKINDFLITPDEAIIISCNLNSDPNKSALYLSKNKGITWQLLIEDYDSKTLLSYDSKNKFLYFVKDKVNKGLYRIKLN